MRAIAVAIPLLLPIFAEADELLPDSLNVRAECRKVNDKGCTGSEQDYKACKGAPVGWHIVGRSIQKTKSAKGIELHCKHSFKGLKEIDHFSGPIKLYSEICLSAHVQSGGGGTRIGTVFYNDCTIAYDIVKLDKE